VVAFVETFRPGASCPTSLDGLNASFSLTQSTNELLNHHCDNIAWDETAIISIGFRCGGNIPATAVRTYARIVTDVHSELACEVNLFGLVALPIASISSGKTELVKLVDGRVVGLVEGRDGQRVSACCSNTDTNDSEC